MAKNDFRRRGKSVISEIVRLRGRRTIKTGCIILIQRTDRRHQSEISEFSAHLPVAAVMVCRCR